MRLALSRTKAPSVVAHPASYNRLAVPCPSPSGQQFGGSLLLFPKLDYVRPPPAHPPPRFIAGSCRRRLACCACCATSACQRRRRKTRTARSERSSPTRLPQWLAVALLAGASNGRRARSSCCCACCPPCSDCHLPAVSKASPLPSRLLLHLCLIVCALPYAPPRPQRASLGAPRAAPSRGAPAPCGCHGGAAAGRSHSRLPWQLPHVRRLDSRCGGPRAVRGRAAAAAAADVGGASGRRRNGGGWRGASRGCTCRCGRRARARGNGRGCSPRGGCTRSGGASGGRSRGTTGRGGGCRCSGGRGARG